MNKLPVTIAISTAIAVCVALIFCFTLMGNGDALAVLDYKKIISESTAVKKAGDYFSELQETYKGEIDAIKDPKAQVTVLEQKQAEFAKKIELLDSYLNTTLDAIIAKYREQHDIAVILPKETAISVNAKLDITNSIIEEFNKVSLDAEQIQSIINTAPKEESATETQKAEQNATS